MLFFERERKINLVLLLLFPISVMLMLFLSSLLVVVTALVFAVVRVVGVNV